MSKREWKPTPRFKGGSALDLLGAIAVIILEEPRRYSQGDWILDPNYLEEHWIGTVDERIPECGTIGCVAGWTVVMTQSTIPTNTTVIEEMAKQLLGLDGRQARSLFSGAALENYIDPGEVLPDFGTREYAELGARHIRDFMAEHEAQLKAYTVPMDVRVPTPEDVE